MKQTKKKKYSGVWQLLRRNISVGQLMGYSLANAIGLVVVLVGLLFYLDSQHNADDQEQFFSKDYVVISKHVEGFGIDPLNFSEEDIADLEAQPWVEKLGRFTASEFTVYGSVSLGRGMSTYLFFEAIPDEFFDIQPRRWHFDPNDETPFVPVIINKDYLTLYNFGFAIPQGLPQLSEEAIGAVPLRVRLTGGDREPVYFDAGIVGFSTRLNTIAVPQTFMDWGNEYFNTGEPPKQPSRLILEVDRLKADQMNKYFAEHQYEQGGEEDQQGKIAQFLSVVSSVVTSNGILICALAMFILMLSIFLLMQQSKEKLRNLMLLGYSPATVGKYYIRVVLGINAFITVFAVVITLLARGLWTGPLGEIGAGDASPLPIVIAAAIYLLVISLINIQVIRRRLLHIWHGK